MMRISKTFILLLCITLISFTSVHKYYLSLTQIEFNNESKSVEVIINVFIDDIELALNDINSLDLQLNTKKEPKNSDIYFESYLKKHVKFKIDNKEVTFQYLGKEYDGDIVFFYLEISDIESVQSIYINNQLLIKHFPKQQNLVKSKVNGKHKSELLTKENDKAMLKY